MKVDIWMPIYINDYLADTMRLDAEKHGVYFLLMMDYWKHKELPSDLFELAMIARVSEDNKSLAYILKNFFSIEGDKYIHKRIEKELQAASARRESARENGKKGGRPRNNPEKTHGLNEGKPTDNREVNPNHNPQKSSSSSSSSSHIPTQSNTPKKERTGFNPDLSFIEDDEMLYVFDMWCRGKSKKYQNQIQVENGFKKLNNLSSGNPQVATQIVENSLAGNWAGLFPIEGKKQDNHRKGGRNFEI